MLPFMAVGWGGGRRGGKLVCVRGISFQHSTQFTAETKQPHQAKSKLGWYMDGQRGTSHWSQSLQEQLGCPYAEGRCGLRKLWEEQQLNRTQSPRHPASKPTVTWSSSCIPIHVAAMVPKRRVTVCPICLLLPFLRQESSLLMNTPSF